MGFTCLHTACQYQQYHIIDYLVNAAKVNPDGVNGQSKKPSEVVGNDFTSYLLYGRMKAVNTPPTMSFQSKSPSPSSTMDQPSTTSSKYANGVIETESQSLSQSPWANVALRKSTQSNQDSKFKSKPYVPPSNVSFLPPKTNTTSNEDKLAIARERMKTKKNDSWMKPKAEDDTPSDQPNLPQQSPPSPQVQPRSASIKYSSIEMDSSSDESDNENENDNTSVEPLVSEPPAEPEPISLFSKISAWFENEDNLSLLEEYFGVGNELKEDINAIVEPTTNETLLHRACTTGMINIVQCLIEGAGSNVNAVDSQGSSPLHYAIRSCQPLIAKYLIKKCGSDLRLKDCNQLTPLELCNQLLAQTDGDNHAALLDIQQVLEKYENKSIEKRLKIIQPVYQAR